MEQQRTLSIILPGDVYQAMSELAEKQDRSLGAVIRDAIGQYLAGGVVVVPVRGLLDKSAKLPDVDNDILSPLVGG